MVQAKAMGVSREGINTKDHAMVASHAQPLAKTLTCGNCHDTLRPKPLFALIDIKVDTMITDQAYDANR